MKKEKKNKKTEQCVRQLTPEELAEEERKYNECKKPIKIGWMIYGIATILYLLNGLIANNAVASIPQKDPIVDTLSDYKNTQEYNDFLTETQKEAVTKLVNGEITIEEYEYIIETTSSDEKFEEFLRSLKDDTRVQEVIKDYDKYAEQMDIVGKRYAGVSITSLSSLLVATLILAKYRFREMDIEEARKKREEAKYSGPIEML